MSKPQSTYQVAYGDRRPVRMTEKQLRALLTRFAAIRAYWRLPDEPKLAPEGLLPYLSTRGNRISFSHPDNSTTVLIWQHAGHTA